jgi:hypothetical protein
MARIHTILQGFVDLNLETDEKTFFTKPPKVQQPTFGGPGGPFAGGGLNPGIFFSGGTSGTTTTTSGQTPFSGILPSGFTGPGGNLTL